MCVNISGMIYKDLGIVNDGGVERENWVVENQEQEEAYYTPWYLLTFEPIYIWSTLKVS